jgi:hypothetical protein
MTVRERVPRRTARRSGMREARRRHLVPTTEARAIPADTRRRLELGRGPGHDAYEGSGSSWSR